MNDEQRARYYQYLYDLRDSGRTNMFGAAPFLQRRFGLARRDAEAVLLEWMDAAEKAA
jgi:hypothetical protein